MVGIVTLALLAPMVSKTKARKVLIVVGLAGLATQLVTSFVLFHFFVKFYINL